MKQNVSTIAQVWYQNMATQLYTLTLVVFPAVGVALCTDIQVLY